MKRFWHTCLAMIATATMTAGVANAQNDWNVPSEIGSYQSILSRAGYGNGLPPTAGRAVGGSGTANVGGSGTTNLAGSGTTNIAGSGNAGGFAPHNGGFVNGGGVNGGVVNGGVVNGGVVNGGAINGGFVNGGVVNGGFGGGVVTGEVINGGIQNGVAQPQQFITQPRVGGAAYAQPAYGAPVGGQPCSSCSGGGGEIVDAGYGYGGPAGGGIGFIDPGYTAPAFTGNSVGVSQIISGATGGRGQNANTVVGIFALSFARDYEDGVLLSQNPSGDQLFTDDADEGDFGGYGVSLARRNSNGKGLELRYWAFNTGDSTTLGGNQVNAQLPTLAFVQHQPSARDALSIFSEAVSHTVERETDINNFEVNLLNNGGYYKTRRGRSASFEVFGGLRWFQFDERLAFTANGDTTAFPLATESFSYQSEVNNDLWGLQLGARNELCFTEKIRGFVSVSTGIFNNRIESRQNFADANGVGGVLTDGPSTGQDYDFRDTKDDVAIIGELDAGFTYQIGQRTRARFGYRTFGVAGVALAADQIPADFRRTDRAQRVNSNGSLLLHGGYAGLEFCF